MRPTLRPEDRIIFPLDVPSVAEGIELVKELLRHVGRFKIGLQMIYAMLRSIITAPSYQEARRKAAEIRELFKLLDGNVLLDGKLDDIPNTVGSASIEIAGMGVWGFNVHASAGREAVRKAIANKGDALVFGVTVLTSIVEDECRSIFGDEPNNKVLQFATMLVNEGADGIICAPKEGKLLRMEDRFDGMYLACPNVRSLWAQKGIDDQDPKRQMTPGEVIKAGIDYAIIGRPIREPPEEIGSPAEAAQRIAEEISQAFDPST